MRAVAGTATTNMISVARRDRRAALRYGPLLTWLVSGTLIIIFASYIALPFGLSVYIPRLAAQHGMGLDVQRVWIDPFESRLRLSDVRLGTTRGLSIKSSRVEARIDLAALLSGRLVFDRFRLSEAKLHASKPRESDAGAMPAMPAGPLEGVSVGEFIVDDVELATASETLGRPVVIEWLQIASIDDAFRPEGATVRADVAIGEGRVTLHGQLALDEAGWTFDAAVSASGILLDGFPALYGFDGSWRGRFDGSGPVRLVYWPATGALSASTGGRWAVEGLEIELSDAVISEARADWDGAAFMAFSGDVLEAISVEAELYLHALDVDIADAFRFEAAQSALKVDVSRTDAAHDARLMIAGNSPVARFHVKGGAFEAVRAEATDLVSRVVLTFADDPEIEVVRLESDAFATELPAGRSLHVERLHFEHVAIEPGTNAVSVAAAAAERVEWQGFATSWSTGTVTRLAAQELERHGDGELRLALASAAGITGADGEGFELWLRDVTLDSTTLSPAGAATISGVQVSDVRLANEARTVALERLSLGGIERDEDGTVSITSGRARSVDHAVEEGWTVSGSGFVLAGATVSGQAWEGRHVQFGRLDIETGDASYVLHEPSLVDAAGEGGHGSARVARLGALEHVSVGSRIILEELAATSPVWDEGGARSDVIETASLTLETVGRSRWESNGWTLTGVETMASGGARAATVALETLVMNAASGSTASARGIALTGLTFDGESGMWVSDASMERMHYRADNGSGAGVTGLRVDALEWNGEALAAERGVAPRVNLAVGPARASFDTVGFTSAHLDADGTRWFETLTIASHRGGTDRQGGAESMLEWTVGELKLGGYLASAGGESMLDSVETRNVEVRGKTNEARLRTDRLATRGIRIDPAGAMAFAETKVEGVTLYGAGARASASARSLRVNRLSVRESSVEVGSLDLAGIESTIGVAENGGWTFPELPVSAGHVRSPFKVRIDEADIEGSDSKIHLFDRTTDPDFAATLDIMNATLHGFDSGAIDKPARFSVEAAAGTSTTLRAHGTLIPTLTGTDLDLDALIRGLFLPELSPYSRLHLGRDVAAGYADVALDLAVRSSDLEGVADFSLDGVVLGGPAPVGSRSLDQALTLLQEERGTVELKIPLRGKADAPDFNFDALVTRALTDTALETAGALLEAD